MGGHILCKQTHYLVIYILRRMIPGEGMTPANKRLIGIGIL